MPRSCKLLVAVVALTSAACEQASSPDQPIDLDWGLGGKADDLACDSAQELCWPEDDIAAMRGIMGNQITLALGAQDPVAVLRDDLDRGEALAHKLTEPELQALRRLRGALPAVDSAKRDEVLSFGAKIRREVVGRLMASYVLAFAVPAGLGAEDQLAGKSDGRPSPRTNPRLTPDMVESLNLIRSWGALGKLYAYFLESGDCLTRSYQVLDQQNFKEWAGTSREARVNAIISHYEWAAGGLGLLSGLETIAIPVPVLGSAYAFYHELYQMFQYHACMTFEIASVYGWDIRVDRNLHRMVVLMVAEGLGAELIDLVGTTMVLPTIAKVVARRLGLQLPSELAKQLATHSLARLFDLFRREAREKITEEVLNGSVRTLGKTVLGYATLGLAVFVSGAANWVLTERLGRRVAQTAKNRLRDLMIDGMTHMADQPARDCIFEALSAIAASDGKLDERELRFYQAFLVKSYYAYESRRFGLWPNEQTQQSCRLRRALSRSAPDSAQLALTCIHTQFQDDQAQAKIDVLGSVFAMMRVDGYEDTAERTLYEQAKNDLRGSGLLDGPSLDLRTMTLVERMITFTLRPGTVTVDEAYRAELAGLLPEDVLDYLRQPEPATAQRLRQALTETGICGP